MGMSVGGHGNLNSDPNLVPMIDVLLVLLVIFMIMVPMTRRVLDLQLPDPNPQQTQQQTDSDQIVLEVLPGENYAINKEPVTKARLSARLHEVYDARPNKILFVKGDPTVKFQDVVWAMDQARGAGVLVMGITPKETAPAGGQ